LAQRHVDDETVNIHLKSKNNKSVAKDILGDIFCMPSHKEHPLWLITDLRIEEIPQSFIFLTAS
jgi:hypothetical protein